MHEMRWLVIVMAENVGPVLDVVAITTSIGLDFYDSNSLQVVLPSICLLPKDFWKL